MKAQEIYRNLEDSHKSAARSLLDYSCQQEEENAKLRDETERLRDCLCHERTRVTELMDRAEAAEAKLKAASEQEPVDVSGYMNLIIDKIKSCTFGVATPEIIRQLQMHVEKMRPVYLTPVPPVDVQWLLRRIAELERKLAEQQSIFNAVLMPRETSIHKLREQFLAQAREEGRKEAVPEAAPTPGEK